MTGQAPRALRIIGKPNDVQDRKVAELAMRSRQRTGASPASPELRHVTAECIKNTLEFPVQLSGADMRVKFWDSKLSGSSPPAAVAVTTARWIRSFGETLKRK